MINEQRLVATFKYLVKIDSLSYKETAIMNFLEEELKSLGLKPYPAGRPVGGTACNLAVDLPGRGPRLILNAHVDTVAPGNNIKPIQRGTKIYSNGTTVLGADDKTGVAVILEILRMIKEKQLVHPNLRIIFTVAEEVGLCGAKAVPAKLLKADYAITLDHGEVDAIVNQAPAQDSFTAVIIGKAAHAGIHPEKGINAIKAAGAAIAAMKIGRLDYETTANIGLISGGRATNIVPDHVEIKGEARSHNPAKLKKQIEHMKQVLTKTCAKHGAKTKINVQRMYNAFHVKATEPIARLALAAVRKQDLKPKLIPTGGGSDANIFNAVGVPTINMGVGMHRVHTTSEYADVKEMVKGAEVVLNIIKAAAND
jgi:tripeptide aminopeptidase